MDEAEATDAPSSVPLALAEPAGPARAGRTSRLPGTVLAVLIVTVVVTWMPAGYAACAAILIAGAAVFILWTPDEPLPQSVRPAGLAGPAMRRLAKGAHYHEPRTGALTLTGLHAAALTAAAGAVSGTMSDRSGRREPYLIGSSVVMAMAAAALPAEVLPAAADRAKDLGLINIAYNLPLVVGLLIAGVVLGLMNSYPALVQRDRRCHVTAAATVTGRD